MNPKLRQNSIFSSLQLLFQMENPGVKVEYTISPSDLYRDDDDDDEDGGYGNYTGYKGGRKFYWEKQAWSHCSSSCGGGGLLWKVVVKKRR